MTEEEKNVLINSCVANAQHGLISTIVPVNDMLFGYMRDIESELRHKGVYKHRLKGMFRYAQDKMFNSIPHMGDCWENDVFNDIMDNSNDSIKNEVTKLEMTIKNILDQKKVSDSAFFAKLQMIGILLSVAQAIYNSYFNDLVNICCHTAKQGYDIIFTGAQEQKLRRIYSEKMRPKVDVFNPYNNMHAWGNTLSHIPGYTQEMHDAVDKNPVIAQFRDSLALLILDRERVEGIYKEALDNNPRIEQEYEQITQQENGI